MKHQFTITVDTPDNALAIRVRDEAVGSVEDMIESGRTNVGIDCGTLIDIGSDNDQAAIAAAKEAHEDEGTIEIDDNAIVSFSSDGGAYVQAWVWVGNAEIEQHGGTNPETADDPMGGTRCDTCDTNLESGQVGLCEDCQKTAVESEGGHCD